MKEIGILKTVDAQCLIQNGFFTACKADGGMPYLSATEVFRNAFQYTDPSEGGCPDVTQNPEGQIIKRASPEPLAAPERTSSKGHFGALKGVSTFHEALNLINHQYF